MIFLFRFDINSKGIDFVLNEGIAHDMYADCEKRLKPLVLASCETLLRYKHLSISNTIMDGNILDTGEFEVMLSKGLGKYFNDIEKNNLFKDAKTISDILAEVMDRRILEEKSSEKNQQDQILFSSSLDNIQNEMAYMGKLKWLQAELESLMIERPNPSLKQLKREDLPPDIEIFRGYDHRGHCYQFSHNTLGNLGKLVLIKTENKQQTMLVSELNIEKGTLGDSNIEEKKELFEKIIMIIHRCFDQNFSVSVG